MNYSVLGGTQIRVSRAKALPSRSRVQTAVTAAEERSGKSGLTTFGTHGGTLHSYTSYLDEADSFEDFGRSLSSYLEAQKLNQAREKLYDPLENKTIPSAMIPEVDAWADHDYYILS